MPVNSYFETRMMQINSSVRLAARSLVLLAGMALPMSLAGCLISSDTSEHRSGNYVADTTFSQIKPGQTTAAWVTATLGAPNKVTRVDADTELWDYSYTERKESSGAVFLIFGGHGVNETTAHAYVQLKNGIVTNAWRG